MDLLLWVRTHGFELLEAIGIIAGLTFTALSFRRDDRSRRISNLLVLGQNHQDIWKEQIRNPHLRRILDPGPNLAKRPVTPDEQTFVNLVIQQASLVYEAMQEDLTIPTERIREDIGQFFSLPIPSQVWSKARTFQNQPFARFVDRCLGKKDGE